MAGFSDFLSNDLMRRLDHLALGSRWAAEGGRAGKHRSPLKGASVEFADHRNYVQGDSLRHMDWKVYGRSERFYLKQYQEETSLRTHVVLDASASMSYSHQGRSTKFAYARTLAAAFAYLMEHQQDAVGLVVYDDEVRELLPAKNGMRHTRQFLERLEAHQPRGRTDTHKALHALAAGISRRGLVVMLSDLLDDPDAIHTAIAHFRRRGNDVLLVQILDPAELDLPFDDVSDFIDLETDERLEVDPVALRGAYREEIGRAMDDCRGRCAALRVDYRIVTTDMQPMEFLQALLAERSKLGA